MPLRCAILDDYQNIALNIADWSSLEGIVDVHSFSNHFDNADEVVCALADYEILCVMRERTPLPRALLERMPRLKLIVTSGAANASIDTVAAAERGITVCGTESARHPTVELTIGLMINLARSITVEAQSMKPGGGWQTTIGVDLHGKTLGLIGLGRIGTRVAQVGLALGMNVVAWSQNLTVARCAATNVQYASKDDLLAGADFISLHTVLSARTRDLIDEKALSKMKRSAYLINTSRGPLIKEGALIAALQNKSTAGAALDVFDFEPLPADHPLRYLDNLLLTPHLGYVTEFNYRRFYAQMVENIHTWLDGKPMRVIVA